MVLQNLAIENYKKITINTMSRFLFLLSRHLDCVSYCFIFRNHTPNHLKLHYSFFRPTYKNTCHARNVHKRYALST